jgi:hypothetical protein
MSESPQHYLSELAGDLIGRHCFRAPEMDQHAAMELFRVAVEGSPVEAQTLLRAIADKAGWEMWGEDAAGCLEHGRELLASSPGSKAK